MKYDAPCFFIPTVIMDSILTALTTSSFAWPLQFCLFSTIVSYVASVVTSNVSQVDRVWTFLPNIYTAYFALMPLWPRPTGDPTPLLPFVPADLQSQLEPHSWSPRALLLLGLITTWMFRLSYNTYRRGKTPVRQTVSSIPDDV